MTDSLASSTKLQPNYGSTSERVPNIAIAGTKTSPAEISALSDKVTNNIYTINTRRKDLEQNLKTIGTPKDSQELRNNVHSKLLSANEVVDQTTKDLHQLTAIVKKGDKHQKLLVDKLTNSFKEAVQMYQRVQKQVVEKLKTHILPSEHAILDDLSQSKNNEEAQNDPNLQKALTNQLEFERGLLLEREQTMKSIESCVIDINQIMKEIGVMVHQQGEDINTIENAIETVHSNVESGTSELEKAAVYQTRRRKKTCILFGIAVVVGIVLAIIIAVSLK
uniref:t-SNARE coiled-coil homology domain-containing protein n=1 Tax=Riptortus pedestris TaxID=329032 RepID=R4WD46_RIPPE|nr:conserved hypothetical protein [Riptortus pedestris]